VAPDAPRGAVIGPLPRAWLVALGGAALGFVAVTLAAAGGWLLPADRAVLAWVAAERDCGSIAAATALSPLGAGEVSLLLTGLLAAACLARRQPRAAAALLLLYLSVPIEFTLKHALAQPLPGAFYPIPGACEWYHPALSVTTPHSYPSGYAVRVTYFFVLAAVWLGRGHRKDLLSGRRGPLDGAGDGSSWRGRVPSLGVALLLTSLLAIILASRLVLSWHWPSDLLGGALLGAALAALTLLAAGPGLGAATTAAEAYARTSGTRGEPPP
jgi:diacylglycerol kinase (ATP)